MDQQIRGSVRSHPGEIGGQSAALILKYMATRAIHGEDLVAFVGIAGFLNFRPQLRDQGIFLLLLRPREIVQHLPCLRRHCRIVVHPEPMNPRRPNGRQRHLLGCQ